MMMQSLNIILNNRTYSLSCKETEIRELLYVADQVNRKAEEIKKNNPQTSQEMLLLMLGLSLQDEINNIQINHHNIQKNNKLNECNVNVECDSAEEKIQLVDALTNIIKYMTNLVDEIKK